MTTNDLSWLDAVPADVVPPGYREALTAHAATEARNTIVTGRLAELENHLRDALSDGSADLDADTLAAAAEVAGVRVIAAGLPAPVPVPDAMHQQLLANLTARFSIAELSVGRPPLAAIELKHHVTTHPRDLPPIIGAPEMQVVDMFAAVSAEAAEAVVAVRSMIANAEAQLGNFATFAQAFVDFGDLWRSRVATVRKLRELVDMTDADRVASGHAHSCPLIGAALLDDDPVPPGVKWSLAWFTETGKDGRLLNGRPVRAARTAVPA